MIEPIVFEIPIYRCSSEHHAQDLQKIREKNYLEFAGPQNILEFQDFKYFIENAFCYSWKYNEIVGYLNIYFLGSQFRIEYYYVQNKRINKGIRKKKIIYLKNGLFFLVLHPEKFIKKRFNNLVKTFRNGK